MWEEHKGICQIPVYEWYKTLIYQHFAFNQNINKYTNMDNLLVYLTKFRLFSSNPKYHGKTQSLAVPGISTK